MEQQHNQSENTELQSALATSYAALLELAESDIANIPLCIDTLNTLTTLDLESSSDGSARAPYTDLDEYFRYMLSTKTSSTNEQRMYNQKMRTHFRNLVTDFINRHS